MKLFPGIVLFFIVVFQACQTDSTPFCVQQQSPEDSIYLRSITLPGTAWNIGEAQQDSLKNIDSCYIYQGCGSWGSFRHIVYFYKKSGIWTGVLYAYNDQLPNSQFVLEKCSASILFRFQKLIDSLNIACLPVVIDTIQGGSRNYSDGDEYEFITKESSVQRVYRWQGMGQQTHLHTLKMRTLSAFMLQEMHLELPRLWYSHNKEGNWFFISNYWAIKTYGNFQGQNNPGFLPLDFPVSKNIDPDSCSLEVTLFDGSKLKLRAHAFVRPRHPLFN